MSISHINNYSFVGFKKKNIGYFSLKNNEILQDSPALFSSAPRGTLHISKCSSSKNERSPIFHKIDKKAPVLAGAIGISIFLILSGL